MLNQKNSLLECHIEPDWLLIYAIDKGHLILTATRTG
ncbi:type II toxin-antitoxin system mRNA interferase toxin, RelE/StbE family [Streptococcus sp. 10F2]